MQNLSPRLLLNPQNEEPILLLNNIIPDKHSFHPVLLKESEKKSFPYFLTVNSDNFYNTQIQISENIDKEFTECELLPPNEVCSDLKQVYFIVPSEDLNIPYSKVKNTSSHDLSLTNEGSLQESEIILQETETKKSDPLYIEIFETKDSLPLTSSDECTDSNLSKESDCHSLTFADKIFRRNLLLPKNIERKYNNKRINCDKCNTVLHSEFRNLERFAGNEDNSWPCTLCKLKFESYDDFQVHELEEHGKIKLFPCPHCIFSSQKLLSLEHHIKSKHHFERRFTCKLCNKKFVRLYDLKLHLNIHLELKCYVCHLCGKQFNHTSNLCRHMRTHTKVNPYPCKICNRRFSQVSSLLSHLITHTNGGSCPDCNAQYHSISGLKNHAKSAHRKIINMDDIKKIFFGGFNMKNLRSFHCKVCSEDFSFKKGLKIHENIFHSSKHIPCKTCLKIFPNLIDFKAHPCVNCKKFRENNKELKDRSSFSCIKCHQICHSYEASENHICIPNEKLDKTLTYENNITVTVIEGSAPDDTVFINVNKDEINSDSDFNTQDLNLNSTKNKFEEWTLIPLEGPTTFSKERHQNIKNNEDKAKFSSENNNNLGKSLQENVNERAKLKCKYCEKVFSKKWNWSQHMGTHDLSLRQYQCEHCTKSFSYRSTYLRHIKSHAESNTDKMFQCPTCSKSFKSKSILNVHVKRVHEKVKNFVCKMCSKGFFSKSDYNYHLRLHKGESLYVCPFCGKKFSHTSHLFRHERIHTGERPHKCPCCPKAFIQAVTLREHLRKHENRVIKDDVENDTVENIDIRNSERELGIINLEEMNVLSSYIEGVSADFAMYERHPE